MWAGGMPGGVPGLLFLVLLVSGAGGHVAVGQTMHYSKRPDAKNGEKLYKNGCIACHGSDGAGAAMTSTQFDRPDTFPDFTRCDQTTPEANLIWRDVIQHGGRARGFSTIMPAFGDLLTSDQVNDLVGYLRTFCTNSHWPRGELNLPRAIVTEKAFPEDELVISTELNASGAPGFTTDVIHEQSFGVHTQIEVDVPVNVQDQDHRYTSGPGDITLGVKREMFSSLKTGSILALQGGLLVPTGDSRRGFGSGSTTFEPFAAFDQLFKENTFLQFQMGADLPFAPDAAPNYARKSIFWRGAAGQAIAGDHMLGRLFSPMVEVLGSRTFAPGEGNDWDVLPEMQVTVSKRQHVRAAVGVRTPFANTAGRGPSVMFYMLWDWADGKLWEGWR